MTLEHLSRDVKIGLPVLFKEKTFCALAVVVLALGISGVTTMFSVVNGVMLGGFSFPNGDRLVSLNFDDFASATFFGVNGQILRRFVSFDSFGSTDYSPQSACTNPGRSTRSNLCAPNASRWACVTFCGSRAVR